MRQRIQTALPNVNLTLGTFGGGTLAIGGTVSWTASDVTATAANIHITGHVTLSGGTWDLDNASTLTITNTGSLTLDGGSLTTGELDNAGAITLASGSLTLNETSYNQAGGSLAWTAGTLTLNALFNNNGDIAIDGSSSLTLAGTGSLADEDGGSLAWTGGNLSVSIPIANDEGAITLDGATATLSGLTLTNGAFGASTFTWTSGTGTGITLTNDDGNGATATFGADAALSGSLTNTGTLAWDNTNPAYLAYLTNANIDLSGLDLTGGTYELTTGNTATISSTLTMAGATLTIDSGAALNWTGGNLSIGTSANFTNDGTLTITTTGSITGTLGVAGFNDFSSLGSQVTTGIDDLADAVTPPDFSGAGPAYDWSATSSVQIFSEDGTAHNSGWFGDTDLTAIPQSEEYEGTPQHFNGVLVTPRDMLFAYHADGLAMVGLDVTFRDNNGNAYTRTIVANTRISGTDILVATLGSYEGSDIDLPSSITPMKLLASDFNNYILNSSQDPPVIFTNQDQTLLIGDYTGPATQSWPDIDHPFNTYSENDISFVQSSNSLRQQFYYPVRGGDSGSAVMMLINGQAMLMTNLHGFLPLPSTQIDYGPDDYASLGAINDAIAANASSLGRGSYTCVSTVDLSGFTDYSLAQLSRSQIQGVENGCSDREIFSLFFMQNCQIEAWFT